MVDPYRWMEAEGADFAEWLLTQGHYEAVALAKLPGRAALTDQLAALGEASDDVTGVTFEGGKWFYTKRDKGEQVAKLYSRGPDGTERLLIDPTAFDEQASRATLEYWRPSWSGRFVVFGVSVGGDETGVTRILDTDTGQNLPDRIDRTYWPNPAWLPDETGFFYTGLSHSGAKSDIAAPRVILHKLGAAAETEEPILGVGIPSSLPVARGRVPYAITAADSPYLLIEVRADLIDDDIALHAAPLADVRGTATPWQQVASEADHVRADALHGSDVFLAVADGAPRHRLVQVDLGNHPIERGKTVLAEGPGVIKDIQAAADGLYLREVEGGPGKVVRLPWDGGPATEVPLLGMDGVKWDGLSAVSNEPGVVVIGQSWVHSPAVLHYDPATATTSDTRLRAPDGVDFSDIAVDEVFAPAEDGTRIPLSILHARSMARDGKNPTILDGYGAYGDVRVPTFDRMRRAWFDQGGVYAVAHIRGGGEYGEAWHEAGMLAAKPNSIADFIACAEYLIEQGYTSPERLAGEGRSAGGIVIGGAITARPDLFRAALVTVGITNMLRLEQIPIGPFNTVEFGSAATLAGFNMLLADDAYHHVQDGAAYPAVLVSTGLHDTRVASWQAGKITARLQAATSSGRPVLLRLDSDGGHFGGATKSLAAAALADQWSFLLWQLGLPAFQPPSDR